MPTRSRGDLVTAVFYYLVCSNNAYSLFNAKIVLYCGERRD